MSGAGDVRFSDLFHDTVCTHGVAWAWGAYRKAGMTRQEFRFWCRATLL